MHGKFAILVLVVVAFTGAQQAHKGFCVCQALRSCVEVKKNNYQQIHVKCLDTCKESLANVDSAEIKKCFDAKHSAIDAVLTPAIDCLFDPKHGACAVSDKPRKRRQILPLSGVGPAPFGGVPPESAKLQGLQSFHACMIACVLESRCKGGELVSPLPEAKREGSPTPPPGAIDGEDHPAEAAGKSEKENASPSLPDAVGKVPPLSHPNVDGVDHSASNTETEEKGENGDHPLWSPAPANYQPLERFRRQQKLRSIWSIWPPSTPPIPFRDIKECTEQLKCNFNPRAAMKVLKTCNKDNETPRRKLQEINQQFYECLQEALQSDTESVPSSHPPSDLQNGEEPVLPSREEPKAD